MIKQTIFKAGQTVVSIGSYAYLLTEGKQYIVVKYEAECPDLNFTWPAYVTVIGDSGKPVTCHAYRFRALNEIAPE